MKNIAVYIVLICLCSFSNPLRAAFVIKQAKTQSVIAPTMAQENMSHIQNTATTSPKEPLINPEHMLADIISLGALVLGVLGLIIAFSSGVGLVLGFFAVVLGIAGMHMDGGHKKLAKLGLIFGAIAMAIALVVQYVSF